MSKIGAITDPTKWTLVQQKFEKKTLSLFRYDPTEATGGQPDLSPFHYAILRRNVDLARKMLDYGADPNVIDRYISPSRICISNLTQNQVKGYS